MKARKAKQGAKKCGKCGASDWDRSGRCRECRRIRQRSWGARKRLERRLARETWAPHADADRIAAGMLPRGTSTLRNAAGEVVLQWQKTERDPTMARQAVLDAFADVAAKIPAARRAKPPTTADRDTCCVYPMGDPHLGMRAWSEETGDRDYDLTIARAELYAAADTLCSIAPPSRTAIVIPLGDTVHGDDSTNKTRRSGHVLDVDGRYAKVARLAVDTMIRISDRALLKHERVLFKAVTGNHDDETSLWIALCVQQRYRLDPRVYVDTRPNRFWYFRFGRTLLGATHGDTVKRSGPSLAEIMAHDRPHAWAEAQHRYWYVGHVHHRSVHERPGVLIETFRTMAARDAYAASHGYRSGQDMQLIVLHREHGEINRHRVGIGRIGG
jgi:hypothetical protein